MDRNRLVEHWDINESRLGHCEVYDENVKTLSQADPQWTSMTIFG